ncbi:hypothetical protein D3C73_1233850 [compost metagenome]
MVSAVVLHGQGLFHRYLQKDERSPVLCYADAILIAGAYEDRGRPRGAGRLDRIDEQVVSDRGVGDVDGVAHWGSVRPLARDPLLTH